MINNDFTCVKFEVKAEAFHANDVVATFCMLLLARLNTISNSNSWHYIFNAPYP